ncbi:MAG TPA: hypothetical protein DCK79_00750, partial [Candidatus Atribacteria bacterium]|nr:hypothetical protein [Candidatus Atribacteria bacterium]
TNNPETVTMTKNKAVTAVFVQVEEVYTLDVTILPTEAEDDGCTVTKNPDQTTYACGTVVTLIPQEVACWSFDIWGGDNGSEVTGSGTVSDPYTITMDSDKAVIANFTQICDPPCCLPQWANFKTNSRGAWGSTGEGATYFPNVELDGIASGYNIWNGDGWHGWCINKNISIVHYWWYDHRGVKCSIGAGGNWNEINWIINNRRATDTMEDVQYAIWYFTGDVDYVDLPPNSKWLVDKVDGSFIPAVDQKYAVILDANIKCEIQRIFIEAIRTCCCEAWHQEY